MGLAWPRRILRGALGPFLRNGYPVENPETDVGAETLNPAFAAVAGLTLTSTRAQLVSSWNGSVFVMTLQEEAWNDDHDQAHPALARTGTGVYTYTFASSYFDEDGTSQPTVLAGARLNALRVLTAYADRVTAHAWVDNSNPLVIQLRMWDSTGTAGDFPFWLEVL